MPADIAAMDRPITSALPISTPLRHPSDDEDWLGSLRGWIELCQEGHDHREAWQLVTRSQRTLS